MAGTKLGGKHAAITNKEKYGEDFYKNIGRLGGSVLHPETRPFAKDPEMARRAGKLGGQRSKRRKKVA